MSFSSEVKRELLALDGQAAHCQTAELAAMLSGAGQIYETDCQTTGCLASESAVMLSGAGQIYETDCQTTGCQASESAVMLSGAGQIYETDCQTTGCQASESAVIGSGTDEIQIPDRTMCARSMQSDGNTDNAVRPRAKERRMHIILSSENEQVVCRYTRLLAQAAGVTVPVRQESRCQQKNKVFYTADVSEAQDVQKLLGLLNFSGIPECMQPTAIGRLLKRSCCKRAFLRGAFLISGSMSNPRRSYHFEIVCADRERAQQICQQFGAFGLDAKTVTRKNHEIVYLKEGSQIVDALNIMGAHTALMDLENVRIIKEMRNDINRRVNCETANIHKTVNAAYRQQEAIRFLQQKGLLDQIPQPLREIAGLRMEYPEASIKELGTLCRPPVGKSGVNHRLRKLEEMAGQQGYEKRSDSS